MTAYNYSSKQCTQYNSIFRMKPFTVVLHYSRSSLLQIPHYFRQQLFLQLLYFLFQLTSQLRRSQYFRYSAELATLEVVRAKCIPFEDNNMFESGFHPNLFTSAKKNYGSVFSLFKVCNGIIQYLHHQWSQWIIIFYVNNIHIM